MSLRLLTDADFRRLPWQNGRGTTLELLRRDDAAGAMLWRLSIADVVEPGPFSPLPGIDRVITLIEGTGFDLDFGGAQPPVSLRSFEPLAFSGDWSTAATIVHGPSRDFNVMTARGKITAKVQVVRSGIIAAPFAYILAVCGSMTASGDGVTVRAERGELIECHQEDEVRLGMEEAESALVVHLLMNGDEVIL
ncbi:HutD family protein [Pleomorphomonas sp. PLEO]|uniref:HutD/Ves family protein n=1 Tax=Pleomorphomonas sp. PLEO TaxID=3239306 RepID=UPI00351E3AB1